MFRNTRNQVGCLLDQIEIQFFTVHTEYMASVAKPNPKHYVSFMFQISNKTTKRIL